MLYKSLMPNSSKLPVVSSGIQSSSFSRVQGRSDHQFMIISVFIREHQAGFDEAQSQYLLRLALISVLFFPLSWKGKSWVKPLFSCSKEKKKTTNQTLISPCYNNVKKFHKWRIQWELTTSLSKAETELSLQCH